MATRTIGPWDVSAMGLGCMQLSGMSTVNAPILNESDRAFGVIHAALEAGVTLLDTADIYAPSWDTFGHNESFLEIQSRGLVERIGVSNYNAKRLSSLFDDLQGVELSLSEEEISFVNSRLPESVPASEELVEQPAYRS